MYQLTPLFNNQPAETPIALVEMLPENSLHPFLSSVSRLSTSHWVLGVIGLYALSKILIVLYRISPLHPLAKVPGPTIAAATWWFRTYWEVWPHAGEMTNELHRLHAKYGPVVRIAPNEVIKDPVHYKCFNADDSSVSFCDPVLARERREIIQPFFSRRNVIAMQYVVEDKICLLTHQLRSMSLADPKKHIIDMCLATKSFTNDLIMEFCFAESFNALRTQEFQNPMIVGTEKALRQFWTFKHFPMLKIVLTSIPDRVAAWLMPEASKGPILLKSVLGTQVDAFVKDPEGMASGVEHDVVFNRLLGVGNPEFGEKKENDKLLERPKIGRKSLYDEAVSLLFGGTDTVGNTLSVGTFYILHTPGVLDRLMEELKSVWPGNPWEGMPLAREEYVDGSGRLPIGWEVLEKLPYFTAVIKETLRMANGTVSPLQRLATSQGITVDGWKFPAGTGVSAANPFVHFNPNNFTEPHSFLPDRWLAPAAGALEKYLVSFSRGPRQCPGMNLAWCELYLAFATLFRRFEFELIDTSPKDLLYKDYMLPAFVGRIKVRAKPRVD